MLWIAQFKQWREQNEGVEKRRGMHNEQKNGHLNDYSSYSLLFKNARGLIKT